MREDCTRHSRCWVEKEKGRSLQKMANCCCDGRQGRTSVNEYFLDFRNAQDLVLVNINKGVQVERLVNHRSQGGKEFLLRPVRKGWWPGLSEVFQDGTPPREVSWKSSAAPSICVSPRYQDGPDQDKEYTRSCKVVFSSLDR